MTQLDRTPKEALLRTWPGYRSSALAGRRAPAQLAKPNPSRSLRCSHHWRRAGVLGKPAWVLLCYNPDWRWRLAGQDSPWYPTLLLFRQPQPDDWASVISQVVAALG